MTTQRSINDLREKRGLPADKMITTTVSIRTRQPDHPIKYIVDSSGKGTHKTIEDAMKDAAKSPHRTVLLTIRPHITLEDFNAE